MTPDARSDGSAAAEAIIPSATSGWNLGALVFLGFSLLSLVVFFAKGLVPIFLGEAFLWGALAWYCYKKIPVNQGAALIPAVRLNTGGGGPTGAQPTQVPPPQTQPAEPQASAEQASPGETHGFLIAAGTLGAFFMLLIVFILGAPRQKNPTPNLVNGAQVQQNPLDAIQTGKPTVATTLAPAVSNCPSAIPAGVKAVPLVPEEMKAFVGTKAILNSGISEITTEEYVNDMTGWDVNLYFSNGSNDCVSSAAVEITLQYGNSFFKEHHTMIFEPILELGHESSVRVILQKRTKKSGERLGIQEWHLTNVWGFHDTKPQ